MTGRRQTPTSGRSTGANGRAKRPRARLSTVQIAGGALAALTAAVAASWLGVTGTMIGAAVMSVATTVGTEIYTHYLRRTGAKVRQHTVTGRRQHPPTTPNTPQNDTQPNTAHDTLPDAPQSTQPDAPLDAPQDPRPDALPGAAARPSRGRTRLLRLGGAAALVFTISFGSILVYQVIAGQTVADQLKGTTDRKAAPGKRDGAKERRAEPASRHPRPRPATPTPSGSPTPTPSSTPSTTGPQATPTITPTGPASTTPTPTPPEPSAPPSSEQSPPPETTPLPALLPLP